jgi:hypothetical protein
MNTGYTAGKLLKLATIVSSAHPAELKRVEPLPEGIRLANAPERATAALPFHDGQVSSRDAWPAMRFGAPPPGESPFNRGAA